MAVKLKMSTFLCFYNVAFPYTGIGIVFHWLANITACAISYFSTHSTVNTFSLISLISSLIGAFSFSSVWDYFWIHPNKIIKRIRLVDHTDHNPCTDQVIPELCVSLHHLSGTRLLPCHAYSVGLWTVPSCMYNNILC